MELCCSLPVLSASSTCGGLLRLDFSSELLLLLLPAGTVVSGEHMLLGSLGWQPDSDCNACRGQTASQDDAELEYGQLGHVQV